MPPCSPVLSARSTPASAYPLIDPVVVADISLNGQLQANDTTSLLRVISQVGSPNVPPLPGTLVTAALRQDRAEIVQALVYLHETSRFAKSSENKHDLECRENPYRTRPGGAPTTRRVGESVVMDNLASRPTRHFWTRRWPTWAKGRPLPGPRVPASRQSRRLAPDRGILATPKLVAWTQSRAWRPRLRYPVPAPGNLLDQHQDTGRIVAPTATGFKDRCRAGFVPAEDACFCTEDSYLFMQQPLENFYL